MCKTRIAMELNGDSRLPLAFIGKAILANMDPPERSFKGCGHAPSFRVGDTAMLYRATHLLGDFREVKFSTTLRILCLRTKQVP